MNVRDLWNVDWLIEPLYEAIDHQLSAIIEPVDDGDEDYFDVDDAREHAETLFGVAFVAAQSYAVRTVEDLNRLRARRHKPKKKKPDCYACDNRPLKEGVTRIQLINAAANYFKHHGEWAGWPSKWPTRSDRGANDAEILRRVGMTEGEVCPCIIAVEKLGTNWKLVVLHQILKEWREHLLNTLM